MKKTRIQYGTPLTINLLSTAYLNLKHVHILHNKMENVKRHTVRTVQENLIRQS